MTVTTTILSAAAATHGVALALAALLVNMGRRRAAGGGRPAGSSEGAAGNNGTSWLSAMLACVFLALPLALAAYCVTVLLDADALLESTPGVGSRTGQFLLCVWAVIVPQLIICAVFAWVALRFGSSIPFLLPLGGANLRRRRERLYRASQSLLVIVSVVSVSLGLLYCCLLPALGAVAPVAAVLVAVAAMAAAVRTHAATADEGRPSALDKDAPLAREVEAIARSFGWAPNRVLVYRVQNKRAGSPGRADDDEQLLAGLDRWRTSFNPLRPAVPEELAQTVEPGVVSVGVAMRYANAALLNPLRWPAVRLMGGRLAIPGGLLALLIVLLPSVLVFAVLRSQGDGMIESGIFGIWASALVAFLFAILALMVRTRRFHESAFEAWRAAAPAGSPERSVEDFAVALALNDSAMKSGATADSVVARLRRDARLSSFLESRGEGSSERALAQAADLLSRKRMETEAPAASAT